MRVATSAMSMTAATAISRVLGLVREQVIAALFGAGLSTDAYNTAFRIPNLLRDLFAEGALGAAFVPVVSEKLRNAGRSEAFRLTNLVLNSLLIILGAVTVLIVLFSKELTWLLASGFFSIPGKAELAILMTRILGSFLLFVSLAAVFMGALNAFGHFFLPALAPAVFNLVNIVVTIGLAPIMRRYGVDPILALATGSMLGGIAQFAIQVPALRGEGFRYSAALDTRDPGVRKIASMLVPAIIGLSVTQINVVIDTQIASRFGNGPVTWLNYAFRLIQLPIGLFGVSLGTVNLAAISRMLAGGERQEAGRTVRESVETSFLLNFAASAGLIALAIPIVRVIFQHGRFTAIDTEQTAALLVMYSLGVAAYAAVKILAPAFYALQDPYFPLKAGAVAIGLKIALNIALSTFIGFTAVALTTSIAAWINFSLLSRKLSRTLEGFTGAGLLRSMFRSLLICAAMGVGVLLLARQIPGSSMTAELLRLGAAMAAGVALLLGLGHVLHAPEVDRLVQAVRRRL